MIRTGLALLAMTLLISAMQAHDEEMDAAAHTADIARRVAESKADLHRAEWAAIEQRAEDVWPTRVARK